MSDPVLVYGDFGQGVITEKPVSFNELQNRLEQIRNEYNARLKMPYAVDLVREGEGRLFMGISFALAELIEKALAAIEAHPEGNLGLGYREAIWAQFGPRLNPEVPESKLAHKKRAFLAIHTVKHALPLWEQKWPEDPKPQEIIQQAGKVMAGDLFLEMTDGLDQYDEFWCYFDDKVSGDPRIATSSAISIGYGAALAFYTVFMDSNFDEPQIQLSAEDPVDPYEMDVAQLIAIAFANGGIGEPGSNRRKRKEFWQWWLNEAVPQAWNI